MTKKGKAKPRTAIVDPSYLVIPNCGPPYPFYCYSCGWSCGPRIFPPLRCPECGKETCAIDSRPKEADRDG